MDDGLCTPQLVAQLDVTQTPPAVMGVYVTYNAQNARPHQPQTAIITQVTGFNRTEAQRAMGALIWTDPRYEWVARQYGNDDALLRLHPENVGKDMMTYGFTLRMWREKYQT